MREKETIQVVVIQDKTASGFQEKLNKALDALPADARIEFNMNQGHCCYITYKHSERIPESAEEMLSMKVGRHYRCNDCPYIVLDPDRRSKTHYCEYKQDRRELMQFACVEFYEGLLDGSTHVVTPAEREKQYEEMNRKELERMRERTNLVHKERREKQLLVKAQEELKKAGKKKKSKRSVAQ